MKKQKLRPQANPVEVLMYGHFFHRMSSVANRAIEQSIRNAEERRRKARNNV